MINISTQKIAKAAAFYKTVLGIDILMDHGWITTYRVDEFEEIEPI